jgi:hypothetical protein
MDLTWDGDEPSAAVAEEESAPAAEESAPPSGRVRGAGRGGCIARGQHCRR